MFFEIIAGIFLVIFLIKILDPIIVPGLKRIFRFIGHGFNYLFENFGNVLYQGFKLFFLVLSIMTESLFKGIKLLVDDTIRVLGIILAASILVDAIFTTIAYPMIYNLSNWFNIYVKSFFGVYTFCFTNGVFLYGLYERMTKPRKPLIFFSSKGINIDDLFKQAYNAKRNRTKNTLNNRGQKEQQSRSRKTVYEYDEQNDEYKRSN
ncbi:hypothetical protein [Haloplasma contractile]|uniref:Uncharacterized protein n=1 Tax=Haloplasma contractile SSD-17B TaxID=1033810 RepID=F7PVC8_9MOLU|nr:hypothetical protein [Haloplasma contractile]ERJ12907.1 hypothetical protein HLPCO_001247 [Haloplasma contractile SSD-17B]